MIVAAPLVWCCVPECECRPTRSSIGALDDVPVELPEMALVGVALVEVAPKGIEHDGEGKRPNQDLTPARATRRIARDRRGRGPACGPGGGHNCGYTGVAAIMTTATWNGTTIATSDDTVVVEGNHYFPRDSVREGVLVETDTTSVCPWKGTASYASVVVDGQTNADAAWFYPAPKDAAAQIQDRVAFWKGIEVS